MPASAPKPLFLIADSQLFFWREGGRRPLLDRIAGALGAGARGATAAVYLGASNGDRPEFFDLFRAAIEPLAIGETRHVSAQPSSDDRAFLDRADFIALAGGDPGQGWRAFVGAGLVDALRLRFAAGAVLLGVSAGAMQLGLRGWSGGAGTCRDAFDAAGLAPYIVDVHAEPEWGALREMVARERGARGLGIPLGGGAVIRTDDLVIEPLRRPLLELTHDEGAIREALLAPGV